MLMAKAYAEHAACLPLVIIIYIYILIDLYQKFEKKSLDLNYILYVILVSCSYMLNSFWPFSIFIHRLARLNYHMQHGHFDF